MYKPTEPIRCPKCGAIVKVDLYKILTPNPKCYEWTCPNCGEKGNTKQGDFITFENQIGRATSGYIQKVDEPDPGVGITTTNAMPKNKSTTANAMPKNKSTTVTDPKTTACDIPGKPFLQQCWECPKCGAILAPHQHYCPFCSPSEYGRTNWLSTTPAVVEALTNPNSNTSISVNGVPKVPGSCTIAYSTPCDNIKVTQ